jgi:hypothetical protein
MTWNGECLFDDDRDDTNTMTQRMGRGHAGERAMGGNPTTMVTMSSAGRSSAAWGIGHQLSAPTPPPPSSTTMRTRIATAVGGRHPLPPSGPSRRARCRHAARRCQCHQPRLTVEAWGHSGCCCTCGGGGGGQSHCTHLSGSDPPQGGRWGEEERSDVGGITWQTMSGWERRRRRHCAARATATTMMATGEGGERGKEVGEEICRAVLVIIISIIYSNNTYLTSISFLIASGIFCYL